MALLYIWKTFLSPEPDGAKNGANASPFSRNFTVAVNREDCDEEEYQRTSRADGRIVGKIAKKARIMRWS